MPCLSLFNAGLAVFVDSDGSRQQDGFHSRKVFDRPLWRATGVFSLPEFNTLLISKIIKVSHFELFSPHRVCSNFSHIYLFRVTKSMWQFAPLGVNICESLHDTWKSVHYDT